MPSAQSAEQHKCRRGEQYQCNEPIRNLQIPKRSIGPVQAAQAKAEPVANLPLIAPVAPILAAKRGMTFGGNNPPERIGRADIQHIAVWAGEAIAAHPKDA